MAKRAKASEPSEPEREVGIVKVDKPLLDAPVEVESAPEAPPVDSVAPNGSSRETPLLEPRNAPPSLPPEVPPHAPSGPSFGERVGGFFRFLLRLISLLILLSLLSLALYLALPWLYQKFITPVEQNTAQVRELQSRQQQIEQDVSDLQTKLGSLESAQNDHDGSLKEIDQRLSEIEKEITARTQSLTALEKMQTELQAQNDATSAELDRQIDLLKGMELLSRARLFMYESNFGLARQDVQIARDILAKVQPDAPQPLSNELSAVVQRLDLTLSNLPDFPVAASDDLDIAWQILLTGIPQPTPTLDVTFTPVGTLSVTSTTTGATTTITPTANATLTATPHVTATVQPSATP